MLDILSDLVRGFGFAIDNVIYSLITIVYKLFIYLSEVNLFSMDDSTPLGKLISRIYVFLGIFMLFKVSFSLIQYLIDPNSFSDKSKGFGKLVTNALVTMILLVSTPYIFTFAMNLQTTIITSNAIGKLILGDTTGNTVIEYEEDENGNRVTKAIDTYTAGEMATDVQFLVYGAFFSINPNAKLNGEDLVDGKNKCATSPVFGTIEMAKNENGCLSALQSEFENSNNDMAKYNVQLTDFFKIANSNGEIDKSHQRNFENFGKLLSWRDDTNQYVINYLPFVSAVAGLYIVFLLVTFSIDIAVRAIKLCFLEMIAPIAIVSYIDPKESISNSKLRNWIKESATTYFSLFLRLATIFLVMVLISTIASSVLASGGPISEQINNMEAGYNIWIYLFLIIGAFMFAKKVPQMIENIFGIKMSGEMSLNPFKSIKESPLGFGIGAVAGGAIGGTLGAAAAINEGRVHGEKGLRSFASGIGGAFSGMARGGFAGGKNFQKGGWVKSAARSAGDIAFSKESRRESGPFGSVLNTVAGAAGMPYKIDRFDKEIAIRDSFINSAKNVKETSEKLVSAKSQAYNNLAGKLTALKQTGREFSWGGKAYNTSNINEAENALVKLKKSQARELNDSGGKISSYDQNGFLMQGQTQDFSNDIDYVKIQGYTQEAKRIATEYKDIDGMTQFTDYKSMQDAREQAEITTINLKATDEYENAKNEKEIRQKYAKNDWVNDHRK